MTDSPFVSSACDLVPALLTCLKLDPEEIAELFEPSGGFKYLLSTSGGSLIGGTILLLNAAGG